MNLLRPLQKGTGMSQIFHFRVLADLPQISTLLRVGDTETRWVFQRDFSRQFCSELTQVKMGIYRRDALVTIRIPQINGILYDSLYEYGC